MSTNGVFRHGQITAYHDGRYVVRTEENSYEVPFNEPVEIAPVLSVLLWKAELPPEIASAADLEAAHNLILDRLLGQNGQRATKSTLKLLAGIATSPTMPQLSSKVPWKCPKTGREKLISVVDVTNFAFYRDGNRAVPSSIRLGESFVDGPATTPVEGGRLSRASSSRGQARAPSTTGQARATPARTRVSVRHRQPDPPRQVVELDGESSMDEAVDIDEATRFADLLNTLASDRPAAPKRLRTLPDTPALTPEVSQVTTSHRTDQSIQAPSDPVQAILQVLAPHPVLMATYAQQLEDLKPRPTQAAHPSSMAAETPIVVPRSVVHYGSPSDIIPAHEASDRRQQTFRPTTAQQGVHNAITEPSYIGKDPDVYMDHVRTSGATKFLAHPAIVSRLYDIEFGVSDLSILHFPRFNLNNQLDRKKAKVVNMKNFSSKVDLPDIPERPEYRDLTEALSVLNSFAREFLNAETCELFVAAKAFGETLDDYSPWTSYEIKILAFWFTNVFGSYRLAVINDLRSGMNTRCMVQNRFNMQDPELAGLLFKASRNRPEGIPKSNNHVTTRTVARAPAKASGDGYTETSTRRKDRKVPLEVATQIPRKEGRQLCLRFASAQGCPSKSNDRCPYLWTAGMKFTSVINTVQVRKGGVPRSRHECDRAPRGASTSGSKRASQNADLSIHSGWYSPPMEAPTSKAGNTFPTFVLDNEMVRAISSLVTSANLSLAEMIRLWRGQTVASPNPNKALAHEHYGWLLHDYEHVDQMIRAATHGVKHSFQVDGTQFNTPVPNHKSAKEMHNALIKSIRDGQRSGAYLVLSQTAASRWRLHYSPFGCVEKSDANPAIEARVIHDLSFPSGASTNAWSDQDSIPTLIYSLVNIIAQRIVMLRKVKPSATIKLMKGDVKTAYKNLHVHEDVSAYFVGSIPEEGVAVIDLALPFGWTGSGAHYGVFGKAITHLVCRESPHSLNPLDPDTTPFFCFDWVDDHVLVEHDVEDRLEACDSALRLAMTAVLGPRALINKKFTEWSTKLIALGLEWNSIDMTVSMPEAKIHKACGRITDMLMSSTTTRTKLSKLLGSLRHVCSCVRPAKPFFQRLATLWKRSSRTRPIKVDKAARLDLLWFGRILLYGRIRGVPLEYFCGLPPPSTHLYMDTSDGGLCVLHPARREFLRIEFDHAEKELIKSRQFSINVRDQFSALLAVLCWGNAWRKDSNIALVHVCCWIDNTSAVSWCNNLASDNTFSQEMNRLFGVAEAEWGIRVSAEHLAGSTNFLADLGSRAWSNPLLPQRTELTLEWTRVIVPKNVRKAYSGASSPVNDDPWPTPLKDSMPPHGSNGSGPADGLDVHRGFQRTIGSHSLFNWCSSLSSGGCHDLPRTKSGPSPPFTPKSAMSSGIIKCTPDLNPISTPVMQQPSHSSEGSIPSKPRTPVSRTLLEWMATHIDYQKPEQRLFLGAALLGFFYLLRSSEYLAVKGGRHRYALEVRDVDVFDITGSPAVKFNEATHAVIKLRGSKTDQQGRGSSRYLARSGHPQVCPVIGAALLLELATRHGLRQTDPICSFNRSRMLKAEELSEALKAAAAATGLDPRHVSCHSLRSGGVSALIAGGADSTTIKLHGRWRSNVFQRYTHYTSDVGEPLAAIMAGNGNLTSRATSTTRRNGVHA